MNEYLHPRTLRDASHNFRPAQNLLTQPLLKNERANPITKCGEKEITLLQMERP